LLREAVEQQMPGVRLMPALPATDGELALAHDPGWITRCGGHLSAAAAARDRLSLVAGGMVERARRSVGATIGAAARGAVRREGVAANLAGGTHHAYADKGSGYCVFNDVAWPRA
jgi:acetoin utilization deacetylase AcuC-like enzyme